MSIYGIRNLLLMMFIACTGNAQTAKDNLPNLIVITTDGFRWQEVFTGMDSMIASNSDYNKGDSSYLFENYYNSAADIRRKMLLPFFWNTISTSGMIFGNRNTGNKVNTENPYWFSYPGYNEIFTGFADTAVNSNDYPPNPNVNFMAFLNKQKEYKNKTVAFGAWNAFDRILNEKASGFPVINGFESMNGLVNDAESKTIADMLKDSYKPFKEAECLDVFTHYQAFHYLKSKRPKLMYISYGETDEWAHAGNYPAYLNAAHQADQWIADIWSWVQQTPGYKNNTYLFITTDHGRGFGNGWTEHGGGVDGASSIWFALLGPDSLSAATGFKKGEQQVSVQFYQKQFAATMCKLLGQAFTADHPVGAPVF